MILCTLLSLLIPASRADENAGETGLHQAVTLDSVLDQLLHPKERKSLRSHPSQLMNGLPCPKDQCQRIPHTQREAYNRVLIRDSAWLSMANRYGIGAKLLPSIEQENASLFLHWHTESRAGTFLVQRSEPLAFYSTWSRDELTPLADPFNPNRLQALHTLKAQWLQTCRDVQIIQRDGFNNPIAWMGNDCNGWTLWMEYTPQNEEALHLMGLKSPSP